MGRLTSDNPWQIPSKLFQTTILQNHSELSCQCIQILTEQQITNETDDTIELVVC